MAKRRKKTSRRRRRVGAVAFSANSPLVKFGSLAAGYVISDKVTSLVDQLTAGKVDPKITNGILSIGGLYYLFMYRGSKSTIMTALAGLAAGAGAKGLLADMGIMSGYQDVPAIGGYQDVPAIGSYNVPASINGVGAYSVPQPMAGVMGSVPEPGSGINASDR